MKRIGVASLDLESKQSQVIQEHKKFHSVIASSSVDRLAMNAAFYPLKYQDIWVTGLPRNDFILREENKLPSDFITELEKISDVIGDKKFILYAPTFRNAQEDGYYYFSDKQKELLNKFLEDNSILLGIREHMADKANSYTKRLQGENVVDVGSKNFKNIELLYRKADLLITDYSSCFIDFMLTKKPMVSFAYDYDKYINEERGLFYDIEFAFAGKVCKDFDSLYQEINRLVKEKI